MTEQHEKSRRFRSAERLGYSNDPFTEDPLGSADETEEVVCKARLDDGSCGLVLLTVNKATLADMNAERMEEGSLEVGQVLAHSVFSTRVHFVGPLNRESFLFQARFCGPLRNADLLGYRHDPLTGDELGLETFEIEQLGRLSNDEIGPVIVTVNASTVGLLKRQSEARMSQHQAPLAPYGITVMEFKTGDGPL